VVRRYRACGRIARRQAQAELVGDVGARDDGGGTRYGCPGLWLHRAQERIAI
jgi:hypothetical protein